MRAGRKKTSSRQNRKRGIRPLRIIILVAFVSALSAGGYAVLESGLFKLERVVFYGNKYTSQEELMKLMGVKGDDNLLGISLGRLAGRLSGSPWLKAASLRKEYPGRLLVMVQEKEPAALLRSGKDLFLIDGEGNVLEKLKEESVPFLPVIVDEGNRDRDALTEAVSLAQAIKRSGLTADNGNVEIDGMEKGPENLAMKVDGLLVRMGKGQYEKKLVRFFELSEEIKRRWETLEYIDLRFADRVVVKPLAEKVNERKVYSRP
jgi:cell division protein FtsQ